MTIKPIEHALSIHFLFQELQLLTPSCVKGDCTIVIGYTSSPVKSSVLKVDGNPVTVTCDVANSRLSAYVPSREGSSTHEFEMTAVYFEGRTVELNGVVREDEPVTSVSVTVSPE